MQGKMDKLKKVLSGDDEDEERGIVAEVRFNCFMAEMVSTSKMSPQSAYYRSGNSTSDTESPHSSRTSRTRTGFVSAFSNILVSFFPGCKRKTCHFDICQVRCSCDIGSAGRHPWRAFPWSEWLGKTTPIIESNRADSATHNVTQHVTFVRSSAPLASGCSKFGLKCDRRHEWNLLPRTEVGWEEFLTSFFLQISDATTLSWSTRIKGFIICFIIGILLSILVSVLRVECAFVHVSFVSDPKCRFLQRPSWAGQHGSRDFLRASWLGSRCPSWYVLGCKDSLHLESEFDLLAAS